MAPAPKRNARVVLAERPKRGPITPKTFRQEEVDLPELKDGEVLVKVDYVSVVRADPF
jgi:NADPH-dependent curcumin reductase CurA